MDYLVPTSRDLDDVHSLNYALLKAMRSSHGEALRGCLPASCQPRIVALTDLQVERLAAAPFLLFSLHEQDDGYWRQLLDDDPHRDLFAVNDRLVEERSRIVAAAISFSWHLAKRNAYAARLVCGASLEWCQRLAEQQLIDVLGRAASRADLLLPRHADNEQFWQRLLGAGLSADIKVRSAAQMSALQMILTGTDARPQPRLALAACRSAVPIMRT